MQIVGIIFQTRSDPK
ncbi:MAG: hypothetical protein ACLT4D_12715 [Blautia faecis]